MRPSKYMLFVGAAFIVAASAIVSAEEPTLTVPAAVYVNATSPDGSVVTYDAATVQGAIFVPKVLVIYDTLGDGTIALITALSAAGCQASLSAVDETLYDGTNPALSDFHAVIHLNGTTYATDMPLAGQQAIMDFVRAGGLYVGGEWSGFEFSAGHLALLRDVLLLDRITGSINTLTYSAVPDQMGHPVLSGVPSPFSAYVGHNVGDAHVFAENPSTVLMRDERGNAAVVVRDLGPGRVVNFHHTGNYKTPSAFVNVNLLKLTANAVNWGTRATERSWGIPTLAYSLPSGSFFSNGITIVFVTATFPNGQVLTGSFAVHVKPLNQLPNAYAGADRTVEVDAGGVARVTLDGSASSDPDGDTLTYSWTSVSWKGTLDGATPSINLPIGTHRIGLTVSDGKGGLATDETVVTVADTTGPDISSLEATPDELWPPNGKMRKVNLSAVVTDWGDGAPTWKITNVTCNEAPMLRFLEDWRIVDKDTVELRAWHDPLGRGRAYLITVQARDQFGNITEDTVGVKVPRCGWERWVREWLSDWLRQYHIHHPKINHAKK